MSKLFIRTFICILTGLVCYGGFLILGLTNPAVPFIGRTSQAANGDPGNKKISTYDINSKFIRNEKSGKLFMITGKVRNDYSDKRECIKIQGKLFVENKQLVKSETVYCGYLIEESALLKWGYNVIKKKLSDRSAGNPDQQVDPGKSIQFMVVFSDLPKENLEEFTLEVTESIRVK